MHVGMVNSQDKILQSVIIFKMLNYQTHFFALWT